MPRPGRRGAGRPLAALAAALLVIPAAAAASPQVDARAWLVVNPASGDVLASHAARRRVPIASITKLMTVLVTLEHARPSDVVDVDPRAALVGESSIGLHGGERVTVHDLLEAALIQSANDAADALAFHVSHGNLPRFIALMNAKARRLGLRDTHFVRPDGLDAPGHVSSARDVTRLAEIAMRQPIVRDIVRRRTAVAAGRRLYTWNDLLGRFRGLVGVKTGHTSAAGWNEVAAVRRPGVTLYATVLGSPDRNTRNTALATLLRWGFSRYHPVALVAAGRVYARAAAPYGRPPVPLVARRSLVATVRVDRPLVERVLAPSRVTLPVAHGQRLGEVRVYEGRELLARRPLVAARALERPGLAGRVRWYAGRTLHHLWGLVA